MIAHLDLASLALKLDLDAEQLSQFRENLRCAPERHDPKTVMLARQILHERAHLHSFLGSGVGRAHHSIKHVQFHLARNVIQEVHQSRLLRDITVPILDQHDRVFPNALAAHPKLKVSAAARRYRDLETLTDFLLGYPPMCTRDDLLRAYQTYLKNLQIVQPGSLNSDSAWAGNSQCSPDTICFMSDRDRALTDPQICSASADAAPTSPILPMVRAHSVPGSDSPMVLSSRSVLEGLAILGEWIGLRERAIAVGQARRFIPSAYRSALTYSLHCINRASGERYNVDQLLSGELPNWVLTTMGAMLDLSIQIDASASPTDHASALIEKCPGWRLLLIGACVMGAETPCLAPSDTFESCDIYTWSQDVCRKLGWTPLDAVTRRRLQRSVTAVTSAELFSYLSDTATTLRERYSLSYLIGRRDPQDGRWLDFTSWHARDGQQLFLSDDHIEARRNFIGTQKRQHYAVPALAFGQHWDYWWQMHGVRVPQEHLSHIAQLLNHGLHSQLDLLQSGCQPPVSEDDVRVREEFNDILGSDMRTA